MSYRLYGKIEGIKYKPTFKLPTLNVYNKLSEGFKEASFVYVKNGNKFAVSWWVSPKRTRSYPYVRVYNTLQFSEGKVVTIIPVIKDEGSEGDRDFIQWDTVSLMSLLNVYVILGYYVKARKNPKYQNKVTEQEFDYEYLDKKFEELSTYRSDALHWNIDQLNNLREIATKALDSYKKISKELNVKFHDLNEAMRKVNEVMKDIESFKDYSRKMSFEAQHRESLTLQPKEKIYGKKGMIDIANYLGGIYHFTVDEICLNLEKSTACLIEAKNSKEGTLPKDSDIKDGLVKMILYTNLKELYYIKDNQEKVKINEIRPMLRLTGAKSTLSEGDYKTLSQLLKEAKQNNFEILLGTKKVEDVQKFVDFKC